MDWGAAECRGITAERPDSTALLRQQVSMGSRLLQGQPRWPAARASRCGVPAGPHRSVQDDPDRDVNPAAAATDTTHLLRRCRCRHWRSPLRPCRQRCCTGGWTLGCSRSGCHRSARAQAQQVQCKGTACAAVRCTAACQASYSPYRTAQRLGMLVEPLLLVPSHRCWCSRQPAHA